MYTTSMLHNVHPPLPHSPHSAVEGWGVGGEPPANFEKGGGAVDRISLFIAGKEGGRGLFQGMLQFLHKK